MPPADVTTPCDVLVPVKAFTQAKLRLAPSLSGPERATLARLMAERVLAAASPLPVWVVCDDDEVARWARAAGAGVSWQPGRGLNEAVASAVAQRREGGARRVMVAHADLPLARSLADVAEEPATVVLVPDRHDDGTNVMVLPADLGLTFAYGGGSFRRHLAAAEALGVDVRVLRREDLAWDVDVPDDLGAAADLTAPR